MVRVVYENMIIWAAVHNLTTAPFKSSFVSKNNSKEIININIIPSIILPLEINPMSEKKKKLVTYIIGIVTHEPSIPLELPCKHLHHVGC